MPQALAQEVKIDYADSGAGEPALLLMPAWCMSRNGFATLPVHLSGSRRVLALDWRGHGRSTAPAVDFGAAELVEDCLAVIDAAGVASVVPVTLSHAGWVAHELRRRLGSRVPAIVHLDWLVTPAPPPYMDLVRGLASPERWRQARDILFGIWQEGVTDPALKHFVHGEMGSVSPEMWMRSGREIAACYARGGNPLESMAALDPHVPVLHVYAQPADPEYLAAQHAFADRNSWFHCHKLGARSHFPTFEVPAEMAEIIESFVSSVGVTHVQRTAR